MGHSSALPGGSVSPAEGSSSFFGAYGSNESTEFMALTKAGLALAVCALGSTAAAAWKSSSLWSLESVATLAPVDASAAASNTSGPHGSPQGRCPRGAPVAVACLLLSGASKSTAPSRPRGEGNSHVPTDGRVRHDLGSHSLGRDTRAAAGWGRATSETTSAAAAAVDVQARTCIVRPPPEAQGTTTSSSKSGNSGSTRSSAGCWRVPPIRCSPLALKPVPSARPQRWRSA
mmetsp:Transcript_1167/g.3876  ORF Transcript_1167/g.3876 Transcript_1167/m.3876 type:complete len:231 (+) Transcript_1167:250-942(+)